VLQEAGILVFELGFCLFGLCFGFVGIIVTVCFSDWFSRNQGRFFASINERRGCFGLATKLNEIFGCFDRWNGFNPRLIYSETLRFAAWTFVKLGNKSRQEPKKPLPPHRSERNLSGIARTTTRTRKRDLWRKKTPKSPL